MLDKAIEHGKEYRKQYRGAKACDKHAGIMAAVIGVKMIGLIVLTS